MTFLSWILYGFTDFVPEASQTPHSRMTDVATSLLTLRSRRGDTLYCEALPRHKATPSLMHLVRLENLSAIVSICLSLLVPGSRQGY